MNSEWLIAMHEAIDLRVEKVMKVDGDAHYNRLTSVENGRHWIHKLLLNENCV